MSLIFQSCSYFGSLGLKSHKFGDRPNNIIWVQVPGLALEHLSLIRFRLNDTEQVSFFENANCIGKIWNYNLYKLRPGEGAESLSQLVGSKDIKRTCEDYKHTPIWSHFASLGYQSVIIEKGVSEKDSLTNSIECNQESFLNRTRFLRMAKEKNSSSSKFHFQENVELLEGKVFYDKSCQEKSCFASLSNNVSKIWSQVEKRRGKNLILIRDFSYLNAYRSKNIEKLKDSLIELQKTLEILRVEGDPSKTQIIVSTMSDRKLDFPRSGKEWASFDKKGKYLKFGNPSLMSSVLAMGPGSENYCGFFEGSDIPKRMIWTPRNRLLKFFDFKKEN